MVNEKWREKELKLHIESLTGNCKPQALVRNRLKIEEINERIAFIKSENGTPNCERKHGIGY